jgi:hypothetical protein
MKRSMADPYPVPSLSPMPGSAPSSQQPSSEPAPLASEAVIKFKSCRWRRPPEDGPECCGHRDVLPMAGTSGFDAEAWCPDCSFYKLRRTPKKRSPDDYRY